MAKKPSNAAASANTSGQRSTTSTTAAASTDQPSKEVSKAIADDRKVAKEQETMPDNRPDGAGLTPEGETIPEPERINYDHEAEANLTEDEKGPVTGKFGLQGSGDPNAKSKD